MVTALGCGPGTDYPYVHIFQCMLERTDAITNEVLEPVTFVLEYPTTVAYPGILFGAERLWVGSTNSDEDRENGDVEAVAPYSGVLEAAIIWYKKFHMENFSWFLVL